MSAAAPASFWVIAVVGSLALHGAIGMGLYAMPVPEPKRQTHTEITISAPEIDSVMQRTEPETVATARSSEQARIVAQPDGLALTATDAAKLAPQHQPAAVDAQAALASTKVEEAQPAEIAASNNASEAVAASNSLSEAAAVSNHESETVESATNAQIPPNLVDIDEVLAEAMPEAISPEISNTETAPSPDAVVTAVTEVGEADREIQAPVASPTLSANSVPVSTTAPASSSTVAITIDAAPVIVGTAEPSANPKESITALAPAKPFAVAPNTEGSIASATVTTEKAINGSQVVASSPLPEDTAPNPVETDEPAVAMLKPQNIAPDEDLAVPDSSGMRIEDFLSESEGSDCLLALPLDPMQASVEAYAASPEAVRKLGAEYMRVAGINLETEMRPVSNAQCGALRFARSLAQYPNFPLQLALDNPEIASGTELSGVVSGLRKDTLYLMVVDDEGKAELVSSSAVGGARSLSFSSPLTLTGRPASSVQLLIAIASDGPLRNLPSKPGMPASEYFSKLTFEIIGDDRSVAFGMTSFIVR